jgi:hypothetical protein
MIVKPFELRKIPDLGTVVKMIDHFAVLEEPRRPWLEEEALKARFHALTAEQHPDVAEAGSGSGPFAALTVAYRVLSDPRTRLRHLLELEAPEEPFRGVVAPPTVGALFLEMGSKKQKLDGFLKKRSAAGSALAKALLLAEQYALQEDLEALLGVLDAERGRWLETLPALDAAWEDGGTERPIKAVAETAQALGYLDKWIAQVREGLVRLQIES